MRDFLFQNKTFMEYVTVDKLFYTRKFAFVLYIPKDNKLILILVQVIYFTSTNNITSNRINNSTYISIVTKLY